MFRFFWNTCINSTGEADEECLCSEGEIYLTLSILFVNGYMLVHPPPLIAYQVFYVYGCCHSKLSYSFLCSSLFFFFLVCLQT